MPLDHVVKNVCIIRNVFVAPLNAPYVIGIHALTFPFVFLTITRPRKCVVKYEDENGDLKEGSLDGMFSRIFQHEYDHTLGRNFTEYASKLKLDRAYKKAEKEMDKAQKRRAAAQSK